MFWLVECNQACHPNLEPLPLVGEDETKDMCF
jgi:hypothetical protein